MRILGVHPTHTATAALMEDGRISSLLSEERLTRIKEHHGLPKLSIEKIFKLNNVSPGDIDMVAINGLASPSSTSDFLKSSSNFNMLGFNLFKLFMPRNIIKDNWWVAPSVRISYALRNKEEFYSYFKKIGIKKEKIVFVDHHTCHAYSVFSNLWGQKEDMLILTLDAAGDGLCGTINIFKDGKFKNVEKINVYNSLGLLYSRITQYLNMNPLSHEYKVMGLAAYSKDEDSRKIYDIFRTKFIRIDKKNPLRMENLSGAVNWEYLKKFEKYFKETRFDHLAGGVQRLVEDLLVEWVQNAIEKTRIKNVFCAGGVFMNVKANLKIIEKVNLNKFFVFPSCGDESTPIGACNYLYYMSCKKKNIPFSPARLQDLYLGPSYDERDIKDAIIKYRDQIKFRKIKNINKFTASLLAQGEIVARCSGKMEFGARALGNRSILAHPSKRDVVREINEAIKQRDFWMPFACTILKEREKDYIINPNNVPAPYMILSFRTTQLAEKDLINGMHQYDLTCRPQVLTKDHNPDYYEIIKIFEKMTGIGGVLNTSFNIHGEPIVCTPEDAISTLLRSGLKNLIVGDYHITKG